MEDHVRPHVPVSARATRRHRYGCGDDGGRDLIHCSGKHCVSCSAGFVADCIAICCCPCAVVSFLALALVKVPWTVARRCVERVKRRRKKKKMIKGAREEMKSVCRRGEAEEGDDGGGDVEVSGEGRESLSGRLETERIWMQLYEVGQLGFGFGRDSFTAGNNTNLWLNAD